MFRIELDDKNITSYISDFNSLKMEVMGDLQFQIRSNSVTFDIYLQFLHLFNIKPKEFSQLYDKIVKIYYLDQLKFKGVLKSIDYDVKGNTYQVGVDGIDKIIFDTEIQLSGYENSAGEVVNYITNHSNYQHSWASGLYIINNLNIDDQPTYKGTEKKEISLYYGNKKYKTKKRYVYSELQIAKIRIFYQEGSAFSLYHRWAYKKGENDWRDWESDEKVSKEETSNTTTSIDKREVSDEIQDFFKKYVEIYYGSDAEVSQVAKGRMREYYVVINRPRTISNQELTEYFINQYNIIDQDNFTYDIDGTVGKALKDVAILTNSVFRITPDNRLEFQSTKYTTGTTHNYRSNQIKELKLTTTAKDGEIDLSGDFAVFPRIDLQAFYDDIYKSNYYQYEITIPKETGDFLLDTIYIDNIYYGKIISVEYGEFITLKTEKIDNIMSEEIDV